MDNFFNKRSSTISLGKVLVGAFTGFSLLLVLFFNLLMPFSSSESEVNTFLISGTNHSSIPYNDGVDCHADSSPLIGLNQWIRLLHKFEPFSTGHAFNSNFTADNFYFFNNHSPNSTPVTSSLFQQKVLLRI